MKAIKDFISVHQAKYISYCPGGCGSMEYNNDNKELWGRSGVRFLRELAKKLGAEVKTNRNESGSIDRGYVSGFFKKNDKVVYVSISDSLCIKNLGEILFRTAKDIEDYTGGCNNFAKVSEDGIKGLIDRMEKMLA